MTMGADHELKTWPLYFAAVIDGRKRFEYRACTDRDFAVGQLLLLREWERSNQEYTGREMRVRVTYCLWLDSGTPVSKPEATHVCMSITTED
jgi:hypothetical protein